jgi:hypothetical protein
MLEKLILFGAAVLLIVVLVNRLQERDREDFEKRDN